MSDSDFLVIGDKFTVEEFKTVPSKKYPDRLNAKILCGDGSVKWTSAANIVKILTAVGAGTGDEFEVMQSGEFNDKPVLSLKSSNPETQKKIIKATF